MLFFPILSLIYIAFLVFFLGLVLGSALNCLAYRIANHEKWSGNSRSKCPNCEHVLGAKDLVPLFSWLALKGKCRYCGSKISARYPLSELCLGIVFVCLLFRFGLTLDFAVMAILCCCLFCLSLVDLDTMEIPNRFLIIPAVIRLIQLCFTQSLSILLVRHILPAVVIFLFLMALVLIMDKVLKKESMGGGDIKLLTMLGLYFTLPECLLLLVFACIIGILLATTIGVKKGIAFPFGPAISAAAFVTLLCGSTLTGWYLSLF